eukprot:jgi/Mesen1/7845/ME000419S07159
MEFKQLVKRLASFPLAIGELLVIAFLCAAGTLAEGEEGGRERGGGMAHWKCKWTFLKKPESILKQEVSESLPRGRVADLATLLMTDGYEVFVRGPSLYAFKGLVGRLAPIGVHAAMLLIMVGGSYSALGGFVGTTMTPQGLEFSVGEQLRPLGFLSQPSHAMALTLHVNRFFVDYRPNGDVNQFYSDLSVLDENGREVTRKTISVNDPLRCEGVTMYQTDWAISAVQLRVDGAQNAVNLPMADLAGNGGGQKMFGTFLPLGSEGLKTGKGITILARDLQTAILYDSKGEFVGVRRPGSQKPIQVDSVSVIVEEMDPGIPIVYAGFGALMLTTAISYLSHSQVWALQKGSTLYVGGKSNRGKADFERELNTLLDFLPDIKSDDSSGRPGSGRDDGEDGEEEEENPLKRVEDAVFTG